MRHAEPGSRRALLRLVAAGGSALVVAPLLSACGAGRHKGKHDAVATDSGTPTPVVGTQGPDIIMIIRHGEKPTGKTVGVTEDGQPSSGSLTVRGWTRAGALVELFAPAAAQVRAGLYRPTAVFAAAPNGDSGQRHSQTVTPLAARLGQQLDLSFGKGDEAALGAHLTAVRGQTLVAWEHSAIPKIVKGLGAVHPAPPGAWADDRFDMVWVFTREGSGWRFGQVPQLLLAGDRPDPI